MTCHHLLISQFFSHCLHFANHNFLLLPSVPKDKRNITIITTSPPLDVPKPLPPQPSTCQIHYLTNFNLPIQLSTKPKINNHPLLIIRRSPIPTFEQKPNHHDLSLHFKLFSNYDLPFEALQLSKIQARFFISFSKVDQLASQPALNMVEVALAARVKVVGKL